MKGDNNKDIARGNCTRIVAFVAERPDCTRGDVRRGVGLSARHCSRHINRLIEARRLVGAFRGDRWQRLRVRGTIR